MSVELDVSVEAAEFVIRDVTIGRDLAFMMDAYLPPSNSSLGLLERTLV